MAADSMQGFWIAVAVLSFPAWIALAVATVRFARKSGHAPWISYLAWCPYFILPIGYLASFQGMPGALILGFICIFFFWIPGCLYLLYLRFPENPERTYAFGVLKNPAPKAADDDGIELVHECQISERLRG